MGESRDSELLRWCNWSMAGSTLSSGRHPTQACIFGFSKVPVLQTHILTDIDGVLTACQRVICSGPLLAPIIMKSGLVLPFPWIISFSHLSSNLWSKFGPLSRWASQAASQGAFAVYLLLLGIAEEPIQTNRQLSYQCWLLHCRELCPFSLVQWHIEKHLRKATGLQNNWTCVFSHSSMEKICTYYLPWTRYRAKLEREKLIRYQFFSPGINSVTGKPSL